MKTIWKFQLQVIDRQRILMPEGAQILCVQTQSDVPNLWALVDPESLKTQRIFMIYGTGHPVRHSPLGETYIGTFQMHGGSLVFHVFEVK